MKLLIFFFWFSIEKYDFFVNGKILKNKRILAIFSNGNRNSDIFFFVHFSFFIKNLFNERKKNEKVSAEAEINIF